MSEVVGHAKAQFVRARDRMVMLLEKTPDDRINWSPSATARTPLQQVAHSALAISGIHGMLTGKPFPYADLSEMDASMRASEKEYATREQALNLLEANSAEYLTWLDALTEEQIASTVQAPFGPIPMAMGLTFAADHTRGHCSQLEYTQTVYGDLDWYM